jgi:hypothetical protein
MIGERLSLRYMEGEGGKEIWTGFNAEGGDTVFLRKADIRLKD